MKVEFHSGVPDKLEHACRFLRKAQAAGARVAVCGDAALLDRLDASLCSFDALSFVPHVRRRGGSVLQPGWERTPTWLVDDVALAPAETRVLVNLGPAMVDGWERFERVIEIVEATDEDSRAGRQRWRRYGEFGGAELVHHALGGGRP